jgi:hypothetical protein
VSAPERSIRCRQREDFFVFAEVDVEHDVVRWWRPGFPWFVTTTAYDDFWRRFQRTALSASDLKEEG